MRDCLWIRRARRSRVLRNPIFSIGSRLSGSSWSTSIHQLRRVLNVLWWRRERRSQRLDPSRERDTVRHYHLLRRVAGGDYKYELGPSKSSILQNVTPKITKPQF